MSFLNVNKSVYDYCKAKYNIEPSEILEIDYKKTYKKFVIFTVKTINDKTISFKLVINDIDFLRSI